MPTFTNLFLPPLVGLAVALLLAYAPLSVAQITDQPDQPHTAASQPTLISTPDLFQVMNPTALQVGSIMDFTKRDITITLRNIHSEPLPIERLRVTCSCLTMKQTPPPMLLKPQEEMTFSVRLDAAEIKPGPFSRMVLVELAGRGITLVYISGVVQPMLSFAPGQVLKLGTFAGQDVPWVRTVTITSPFPTKQAVTFHPPAEDDLFSYELQSVNPQTFKLSVRPKLPLPVGTLHHPIHLPVTGVDNYGPVVLAISGVVTGWRPVLEHEQLTVSLSEHKPGETISKNVRLVIKQDAADKPPTNPLAAARHNHNHHQADENPDAVAKDELASKVTAQVAFWEDIAKDVATRLPQSVTMTKQALADSILITLTFPTDFLPRRRRLLIPFSYNKNSCGMLNITVKP